MQKIISNQLIAVCSHFLLCGIICIIPLAISIPIAYNPVSTVNPVVFIAMNLCVLLYALYSFRIFYGLITFQNKYRKTALNWLYYGIVLCITGIIISLLISLQILDAGQIPLIAFPLVTILLFILIISFTFSYSYLKRTDICEMFESPLTKPFNVSK